MIVIINYDTGNILSVGHALKRLNCEYTLSADPKIIYAAERVILPGVGDASEAMFKLHEKNLCNIIRSLTVPVLGICVGLQIMCQKSQEGNTAGLGIFNTKVVRFKSDPLIKVPHIGWNKISNLSSRLFNKIENDEYVYYVHSYYPQICNETIATTEHGEKFSGALKKENFYGTQFHPEKSGIIGKQILENFLKL